jgi:hypothetical protein
MSKGTVRADFFDDFEDTAPSRFLLISASSEEEVIERAAAQMRDAARAEFERGLLLKSSYERSRSSQTLRPQRDRVRSSPAQAPSLGVVPKEPPDGILLLERAIRSRALMHERSVIEAFSIEDSAHRPHLFTRWRILDGNFFQAFRTNKYRSWPVPANRGWRWRRFHQPQSELRVPSSSSETLQAICRPLSRRMRHTVSLPPCPLFDSTPIIVARVCAELVNTS